MGMPDLVRWTREAVLALPDDGNRYELFDGELVVTPSPARRHQAGIALFIEHLSRFLDSHRVGRLHTSPADLKLDGQQVAQPDIFVFPGRSLSGTWADAPLPMLAIEVLSPSTARYDRGLKRRIYQRSGVAEYWIVDLDARVVERWRPDDTRPEVADRELTWQPDPGAEPLSIDLIALFEELDA
jgi:Uma2 family endonuclease